MQINLRNLNVNTVENSFVNIGPSVKTGLRMHNHVNQGHGEVVGDGNFQAGLVDSVDDRDIIDQAYKKEVLR